jgi:hypothetical protein
MGHVRVLVALLEMRGRGDLPPLVCSFGHVFVSIYWIALFLGPLLAPKSLTSLVNSNGDQGSPWRPDQPRNHAIECASTVYLWPLKKQRKQHPRERDHYRRWVRDDINPGHGASLPAFSFSLDLFFCFPAIRMARGGSGSRFYSAPPVKSGPAIPGGSTG